MQDPSSPGDDSRSSLGDLELRCPPLPQTLTDALELINQPDRLEVGPVTEMVERDPAVVARLLQTVNSAYYGLDQTVSSTRRAVVMLGPVAVAGLVVGMNLIKLRSILKGPVGPCFMRLVRHNVAVAYLSRLLHEQTGNPHQFGGDLGDPFTCGLLHDFGKIVLSYNAPDEALALYEEQSIEEEIQDPNIRHTEQLLFGYDHTEAGEFAARKLNFPELLVSVISHHHNREGLDDPSSDGYMLRLIVAANLVAKAMGHAFTQPLTWDECRDHPVWDLLLAHDCPNLETVDQLQDMLKVEKDSLDAYVSHLPLTSDALSESADAVSQ